LFKKKDKLGIADSLFPLKRLDDFDATVVLKPAREPTTKRAKMRHFRPLSALVVEVITMILL